MKLVVDTSELFSFFNEKSKARELSLSSRLELYAPLFALTELEEHKSKIMGSFSLTETQFLLIIKLLKTVIRFLSEDEYAELLPEAMKTSPDPEDADFFALAMRLGCPIWSEDRLLREQARVRVLPTEELKLLI